MAIDFGWRQCLRKQEKLAKLTTLLYESDFSSNFIGKINIKVEWTGRVAEQLAGWIDDILHPEAILGSAVVPSLF